MFGIWGNKPYRATDMALETEKEITGEIVTHQPGTEENKSSENHGVDMAAPETCASEEANTELKDISEESNSAVSWWDYTTNYTNKIKEQAQNYSKISATKIGEAVNQESVTNATNNIGSYFNSVYNGIKTSVETIQKEGLPLTEGILNVPNINLSGIGFAELPMLSEFEEEQNKFMKMQQRRQGAAIPPWVGYNEEEKMKKQILSLSLDERNVLREPPAGVDFEFDLESNMPVACVMLDIDSKLNDLRFKLVPKVIKEEKFWRNFFYRVSLIKQSSQLATLEKAVSCEAPVEEQEFSFSPPPEEDEFISDHLSNYDDAEEQKLALNDEELKQIGLQKEGGENNEDEWEAELARELQDFDMVEDADGRIDSEAFESELAEMLENQ